MKDYETANYDIRKYAGMIYSACRMGAWCFNLDGKMYYSTCPYEQEFLTWFNVSGCREFLFAQRTDYSRPLIMSDGIGMAWAADYMMEEGRKRPNLIIMIGPVFLDKGSAEELEAALRERINSIEFRRNLERKMRAVPVLSVMMLRQYTVMMHHILTEEPVSEFEYQGTMVSGSFESADSNTDMDAGRKERKENILEERDRSNEQILLQMVREGNPEYRNFMQNNLTASSLEMAEKRGDSKDKGGGASREARNILIIWTALCARAAMDGGVDSQVALSMEHAFTEEVEKAGSVTELIGTRERMMDAYVTKVRNLHSNPDISASIQRCCDYISGNVTKELSLSELARQFGYTDYYLSRKFQKETGMKIGDYIRDARIRQARVWLLTTDMEIGEISDRLQFGSRNYFSTVFRQTTGMSPAAYREKGQHPGS